MKSHLITIYCSCRRNPLSGPDLACLYVHSFCVYLRYRLSRLLSLNTGLLKSFQSLFRDVSDREMAIFSFHSNANVNTLKFGILLSISCLGKMKRTTDRLCFKYFVYIGLFLINNSKVGACVFIELGNGFMLA